jgi:hypothetical protein
VNVIVTHCRNTSRVHRRARSNEDGSSTTTSIKELSLELQLSHLQICISLHIRKKYDLHEYCIITSNRIIVYILCSQNMIKTALHSLIP